MSISVGQKWRAFTAEEVGQARFYMQPRFYLGSGQVGPVLGPLMAAAGAIRRAIAHLRPDLCPACTAALADPMRDEPLYQGCGGWHGAGHDLPRCPVEQVQGWAASSHAPIPAGEGWRSGRVAAALTTLATLADEAGAARVDADLRAYEAEADRDHMVMRLAGMPAVPALEAAPHVPELAPLHRHMVMRLAGMPAVPALEAAPHVPELAPLHRRDLAGLLDDVEARLLGETAGLAYMAGRAMAAEGQVATLLRLQAGELTEAEAMRAIHGRPMSLAAWAGTCAARLRGLRPGQWVRVQAVIERDGLDQAATLGMARVLENARLHAWLVERGV